MKTIRNSILGILIMAASLLWSEEANNAGWKMFDHPGIVVDGREGRSVMDSGDFIVIELKEGEKPLDYTLGPLKTTSGAVIEYTASIALEQSDANSRCVISLVARDKNMKELSTSLGALNPDYLMHAPNWQSLGNRAVMPEGTHYVELRYHIETPMKLHSRNEGIRSIGLWAPSDDGSLKEKTRISNGILDIVYNAGASRLGILDKRIGKTWETLPLPPEFGIERVQHGKMADGNRVIAIEGAYLPYASPFRIVLLLPPDKAELTCRTELTPNLSLAKDKGAILSVPRIKAVGSGHQLAIPLNGLRTYSTDDPELESITWELQENPAWFGVTTPDKGPAVMCIVDSFQHASLSMTYEPSRKCATVNVRWQSCKGLWDYPREVKFWFADSGGADALSEHFYSRTF